MHSFKAGDQVHVINSTMSGTYFVEGLAVVHRPVDGQEDRYIVAFANDLSAPVERFVDPAAQANPAAYVAGLNDSPQEPA